MNEKIVNDVFKPETPKRKDGKSDMRRVKPAATKFMK